MSDPPSTSDPREAIIEAHTVRPYTVTGGRTHAIHHDLALETLVRAASEATLPMTAAMPPTGAPAGESSERRRIRELVRERLFSIAELSAHLNLPLGVIRVLVGDLVDEGLVSVHGSAQASRAAAVNFTVLESVLHGIDSL